MKIRNGFVSNSSTTSFCIYGVVVSKNEIIKALNPDEKELDDLCYFLEKKFPSLTIAHPDYGDYFIGRSFPSIKDDETGKQFKDSVKQELTGIFGPDIKFNIQQEAWYNE